MRDRAAPPVGRPVPTDWEEIRLEGVSYRYPGGSVPVLEDVRLTLRRGCVTALVGVNGAGKTTLLKVLAGLLEPDEGRVTVGGLDLREADRADYWRRLAVVFQGGPRYHLPLREGVGLAAWACGGAPDAAVRSALARAGLEPPADLGRMAGTEFAEDGLGLSGGQWQRLDLARVCCHTGAEVVLLDEPSSALDPAGELALYREFRAATSGWDGDRTSGAGSPPDACPPRAGGPSGGGMSGRTEAGGTPDGGGGPAGRTETGAPPPAGTGEAAGTRGSGGRRAGLLVSHRLGPVRHADHIVVLDGRSVAEEGTHEALMARDGLYARMFREQQALYE